MFDEPVPPEHCEDVWQAFQVLDTERQVNNGVMGPIPYRAILTFMDENEIADSEGREDFMYLIRQMDLEYRQTVNAKDDDG